MSITNYVLAITDHVPTDKYQMRYAFFKRVKNFDSMHFIDGKDVWHGPQVIDLLWQQVKDQPKDVMREINACNYTTPKQEWIRRFFSAALHTRSYWIDSGLSSLFTHNQNIGFLNLKRMYTIEIAYGEYFRHTVLANHPKDKYGHPQWDYANKDPVYKEADEAVRKVLEDIHKYAGELSEIFYKRLRKSGKHVIALEFQEGHPLHLCKSAFDHIKHYRIGDSEQDD